MIKIRPSGGPTDPNLPQWAAEQRNRRGSALAEAKPRVRREQILEALRESGEVRIDDVVVRFGVSPATARRDLRLLERQGLAIRRHGRAHAPRRPESHLYNSPRDRTTFAREHRIALAAV